MYPNATIFPRLRRDDDQIYKPNPEVPADVVVLAGDIFTEHYGLQWARARFPEVPIVYVMGNHEFYDARYERVLLRAREEAARQEIHLLEKDQAIIGGVRFLGTMLYNLSLGE